MKKVLNIIWFFQLVLIFSTATMAVAVDNRITILVPGTPSSIPYIIAAEELSGIDVKVIHNRSQAHANFLRGDADLIITGLSVGLKLFDQDIPVKIISSHVTSLSYLVFNSELVPTVESFSDLIGSKVKFPFPGSPIEEVSNYFMQKEDLSPEKDFQIGYGDFQSSVKLLKTGKIAAVALPEPFVSLALKDTHNIKLGPSYSKLWAHYNKSMYPQVVLLGKSNWFDANQEFLQMIKTQLNKAIALCQNKPQEAVNLSKDALTLPEDILLSALKRTEFSYMIDEELQTAIFNYYKIIGKELDERYSQLF